MVQFKRVARESGKGAYSVECGRRGRLGTIRYFDAHTLRISGPHGMDPHWATLDTSGRIDRFDTLAEAKDDALKL